MEYKQRSAILAGAALSFMLPDVLAVEDVARALHVGHSAARSLIRTGEIPARKLGRRWYISRAEFLRLLAPSHATTRLELVPPGRKQ